MVLGKSIHYVMDYVEKKKGVEGTHQLIDLVNQMSVIFTNIDEINTTENYPPHYFSRVLNAAIQILNDTKLVEEMGRYFGERISPSFKGIMGTYSPKKSVQYMVIYLRKFLPVFHSGYRSISKNTYWLKVSKINSQIYPFINGLVTYIFEVQGEIAEVKKSVGEREVKYIIKF